MGYEQPPRQRHELVPGKILTQQGESQVPGLECSSWASLAKAPVMSPAGSSCPPPEAADMNFCSSFGTDIRGSGQKSSFLQVFVDLANLGNSCYMNSIIQAQNSTRAWIIATIPKVC